MSNEDMAQGMALKQAGRAQKAVDEIKWSDCPVGSGDQHRAVMVFLVDGMTQLLQRQEEPKTGRVWAFVGGSGLGAGLLTGVEFFGRAKGWW